jgi:hypothetical protein
MANDKFTWQDGDIEFDDVGKYNHEHDPHSGEFAPAGGGASAGLDAAISSALKEKGGFTFNPVTVTAPHHGFAVGGYGTRDAYDANTFAVDSVRDFLKRNEAALKDNFLGGWIDKGKVYLDVTKVFPEGQREAAIAAGKEHDQIAIADLTALNAGKMDEAFIDTGGTGKAEPGKRTAFLLDPRAMTAEEMHAAIVAMIAQLK